MEEKIKAFIEHLLKEEQELYLVDYSKSGAKILVLLDGDNGVSIAQCASISRRTSRFIDEEIEDDSPFRLEISSAGVDTPLKFHRQYVKNTGKKLSVWLKDQSVIEGKLIAVNDDNITLEQLEKKKKIELDIDFNQIDKTIVLPSFK